MDIRAHGGNCCGRRHLYGMNGATTASIIALMDMHGLRDSDEANKIVEVVISRENNDYEGLKREVVGAGFVLVAEWENNSGSTCWMYLHANDWTAFPNGVAINVEPVVPPAPPPPAPVRSLLTQHRNVFADGRRGAWYDTVAAARAAAPRAREYETRILYSNGRENLQSYNWER